MGRRTVSPEILSELLELIYPVQYKWGFALEDVLRFDALTRMQVIILWLIRCEGEDGRSMRRREIQKFLVAWFEASNSTVTKTLHSMARAPLNLVKIVEHPHSGREKNVVLTTKGEQFFDLMLDRCQRFLEPIAAQFSEGELREGIRFMRKWLSSVEALSLASFPRKRVARAQERDSVIARAEASGIASPSPKSFNPTNASGRKAVASSHSRRTRMSRGEIEV
jgi:DNA-binding MarR family transcriptional regulator